MKNSKLKCHWNKKSWGWAQISSQVCQKERYYCSKTDLVIRNILTIGAFDFLQEHGSFRINLSLQVGNIINYSHQAPKPQIMSSKMPKSNAPKISKWEPDQIICKVEEDILLDFSSFFKLENDWKIQYTNDRWELSRISFMLNVSLIVWERIKHVI